MNDNSIRRACEYCFNCLVLLFSRSIPNQVRLWTFSCLMSLLSLSFVPVLCCAEDNTFSRTVRGFDAALEGSFAISSAGWLLVNDQAHREAHSEAVYVPEGGTAYAFRNSIVVCRQGGKLYFAEFGDPDHRYQLELYSELPMRPFWFLWSDNGETVVVNYAMFLTNVELVNALHKAFEGTDDRRYLDTANCISHEFVSRLQPDNTFRRLYAWEVESPYVKRVQALLIAIPTISGAWQGGNRTFYVVLEDGRNARILDRVGRVTITD